MTSEERIINDPIYGRVKLPSLCFKIMDTLYFQRLRFIKCLGIADFVYPSGVHSRFAHSIGVAYLAGKCLKRLRKKQPELDITVQDVLAVQVAGLCHDLGHAPFSHTLESDFVPAVGGKQWKHEDNSVNVFKYMMNSDPSICETLLSVLDSTDVTFICEAISPERHSSQSSREDWCYKGRNKDKAFLYEIIANKSTGIDVDRFDYIRRDAFYVGIHVSFDLNRLLDNMVVTEFGGQRRIAYLDKIKLDVLALYHTRKELHTRVYQHKTVKLIGAISLYGNTLRNLKAYNETERNILYTTNEQLQPARRLLERIVTRNLFSIVCCIRLNAEEVANLNQLSEDGESASVLLKRLIIECASPEDCPSLALLNNDMVLTVARVMFGKEMNQNGFVVVPFCNPKTQKFTMEEIQVLASDKSAMVIYVYSKSDSASSRQCIASSCQKWCRQFSLFPDIEPCSCGCSFEWSRVIGLLTQALIVVVTIVWLHPSTAEKSELSPITCERDTVYTEKAAPPVTLAFPLLTGQEYCLTMAPAASAQQLPPKELALFKRIVKCYEHKQYRNGLKFAKQILSNPKFAEHGETLAMKGLILNCLGKKEEANEYVKRGLTKDVRSHVCWHVYGLMQRSEKKYDEAIKAYRNALKIEKENIQILRDLSLLQLQMRDLEGYKETRYQLFILRPTQRVSWIGFALGLHLVEDYDLALSILEEFRKTQPNKAYDFEHSEFLLYQNMVYREAGRLDEALAHLEKFQSEICDQLSYLETKADLLYQLGRKDESALIYRKLLTKNSENVFYYKRLEECLCTANCSPEEVVARRVEMYDEIAKHLPRSLAASRLPLAFVPESSFVPRLAPLLVKMLRKGAAPVFTLFRFLYDDPVKVANIERLVLSYCESLENDFRFPGENEVEAPSTILWVYYYLALHFDYLKNFQEALAYVDKGLDHTPTLIELYILKARIYKHAGNRREAVRWIEEAQSLDTADRYVNSKCAKYMLQAGMVGEAIFTCSKFTREGVQTVDSLNDMQCMWFETECARAFRKMGQFGEALKKCYEIDRHFTDIIEDQFDFHTYCFRRMTLCAYVRLLRLEDVLRTHDFFFKAAKCAIKIYLRLHDAPHEATADMDGYSQNSATTRELRKQFRKQRKKAAKAEMERQKTQRAPTTKSKQETEIEESHRPVFDPAVLAKTEKPLEDALLFLNPLIQLNCDKLAAYTLGFEVYYRRGKVLLMLLCLRKAEKIDPESPQLHWCKVKFLKYTREHVLEGIVSEIVNEAFAEVRDCVDLKSYNLAYYKGRQQSLPHRLAVAEVMYFLDPSEHDKAVEIATDLKSNLQNVSWKNCRRVFRSLLRGSLSPVPDAVANDYSAACHSLFPLATVFQPPSAAIESNHVTILQDRLSPDEGEFNAKLTI
uniref:HD domain-containing protein n=1 Tax=Trichuris muris TaxID=70415 RepID=A0A5S6QNR4_TRIMR